MNSHAGQGKILPAGEGAKEQGDALQWIIIIVTTRGIEKRRFGQGMTLNWRRCCCSGW